MRLHWPRPKPVLDRWPETLRAAHIEFATYRDAALDHWRRRQAGELGPDPVADYVYKALAELSHAYDETVGDAVVRRYLASLGLEFDRDDSAHPYPDGLVR